MRLRAFQNSDFFQFPFQQGDKAEMAVKIEDRQHLLASKAAVVPTVLTLQEKR